MYVVPLIDGCILIGIPTYFFISQEGPEEAKGKKCHTLVAVSTPSTQTLDSKHRSSIKENRAIGEPAGPRGGARK